MEKVETRIIEHEERTYHFYCDDCGTHIGTSVDHGDGWYQKYGEFDLRMFTPRGWYKIEKCFCNECNEKFLNTVYASLEEAGFKLDWEWN